MGSRQTRRRRVSRAISRGSSQPSDNRSQDNTSSSATAKRSSPTTPRNPYAHNIIRLHRMPLACPLTMPSVQHATWAMTRFPPIRQLKTTDTTQSAQRRRKLSSRERRYAEAHYHLPLTTADGVCSVVHSVDLAGFQLPSIRALVDDVIAWARRDRS